MKSEQITATLAQKTDKARILELNKLEYGASDILATCVDFDWRYDQNPAGQATVPVIRDGNGDVVGFIWVVPLRIRVKGQNYLAATGTNLVIHPEFRNTFGYIKLIRRFEQVFKDNGIPLHFSFVSEDTYHKKQKNNPQSVSTIPLLIKPLDFKSLAQTYFTRGWQRSIFGQIGQVVSPFFFHQQPQISNQKITIKAIDQFDDRFDDFWRRVQDKYPVMVIRDRAFLAWRFARLSGRDYCILVARVQDQILGYIVLRCSMIRGVKTGLVMDLLVCDGDLGEIVGACLMAEAEAYFRAREMSLVAGLMAPLGVEYRILRRAGYIPLTQTLAPRVFRFAFFLHNTSEKNLISLSMREWFITIADYESL